MEGGLFVRRGKRVREDGKKGEGNEVEEEHRCVECWRGRKRVKCVLD